MEQIDRADATAALQRCLGFFATCEELFHFDERHLLKWRNSRRSEFQNSRRAGIRGLGSKAGVSRLGDACGTSSRPETDAGVV
jgi:hypothetical protein